MQTLFFSLSSRLLFLVTYDVEEFSHMLAWLHDTVAGVNIVLTETLNQVSEGGEKNIGLSGSPIWVRHKQGDHEIDYTLEEQEQAGDTDADACTRAPSSSSSSSSSNGNASKSSSASSTAKRRIRALAEIKRGADHFYLTRGDYEAAKANHFADLDLVQMYKTSTGASTSKSKSKSGTAALHCIDQVASKCLEHGTHFAAIYCYDFL
jgi:hypothetical protein